MTKKTMSDETAKRRGYVRDKNGNWRKKTVLEKYFDEGYLELPGSVFSAAQRKKAGEILAADYYLGNYHSLQSINMSGVRIKTTGICGNESFLYYKERYLKAMKYVPYEFWNILFRVCIEDNILNDKKEKSVSEIQNKYKVYCLKVLLCLGLDRLIKFYSKKIEKSS